MKLNNAEESGIKKQKRGRRPSKVKIETVAISTRVPKYMHSTIKELAVEHGVSTSMLVSNLLEADIKRFIQIQGIAKETKTSSIKLIAELLDADIKKMNDSSMRKMLVVSTLSKMPYVIIGTLSGLGVSVLVKYALIQLHLL